MVDQHVRGTTIPGVALGVGVALVGWWATFISLSLIDDAAAPLGGPAYPVGPRVLLVAAVAATCAVAVVWRHTALTMAAVAMGFVIYSLLVTGAVVPDVLLPLVMGADVQAAPGLGLAEDPSAAAVVRDLLYAVVIGGVAIPLPLLGGLWLGIALWWLNRSSPTVQGAPRFAIVFAAGIVVAVAGWWSLPVVARAMIIMLSEGRDAFSPVPSLMILFLAAGSGMLVLRWPALGLGATVGALAFTTYSLVRGEPASGMILMQGSQEWWSISVADLEHSIRSTAFRPGTLELTAAWTSMTLGHLGALRPAVGRQPDSPPSGLG